MRDLPGQRRLERLGQDTQIPLWKLALCTLPLTSGAVWRLVRHGPWFVDFKAVVCGGQHFAAGQALYDPALACPDPAAARFVYAPWVARTTAGLIEVFGAPGVTALYVLLFAAAVGGLFALLLGRRAPGAARLRAGFLGLLPGGVVAVGNVAVVLHSGIAAAAMTFRRWPWLFIAAVACAAAVKPVFLTYLAVVVLARKPWSWRVTACGIGLCGGLAPTLAFAAFGGQEAAAWWAQLSHFVNQVSPGDGLFGWMDLAGVSSAGLPGMVCALAWAGLVTGAGLLIVERGDLSPSQRAWAGLACGVLANPRLMSEDLLLLGPGLLALVGAADAWRPRLAVLAVALTLLACAASALRLPSRASPGDVLGVGAEAERGPA